MKKMSVAPILLALGACFFTSAEIVQSQDGEGNPSPQTRETQEIATRIVQRTNDYRQEQERGPVVVSPVLQETTQDFAAYMAEQDKYSHTADGRRPSERAAQHGYEYCQISENIAYIDAPAHATPEELAEQFAQGWINSPKHRKNMVDPTATETGVAVARSDATGRYYAVQMFGRPRTAAIRFEIANESPREIAYQIDEQTYQLPPRHVRNHAQCRPSPVKFVLASETANSAKPTRTVTPRDGDRFAIVDGPAGLKLERR